MKKRIVLFVMIIALAVNIFAQNAFDYLEDALVNVLTASTIVQMADFEYKSGSALWGTYLEPGKSIALYSQYDGGVEYLMLAAAHDPDRDIDLKVYQGRGTDGTVIKKDTSPDAAPVVRFTPPSSGYYTFEIINSSDRPAFAALVVLRYKKNSNFSFLSLAEALDNTLNLSKILISDLPYDTVIPPNTWALFGGNVQQGSSTGYFNATLSGNFLLVGAGEYSVNNCDVEVIEQPAYDNKTGGRKISQNSGAIIPCDFALFSAASSKYYSLDVYNKSSQKASSFMFGFLMELE